MNVSKGWREYRRHFFAPDGCDGCRDLSDGLMIANGIFL